jgi:hypothetical protein
MQKDRLPDGQPIFLHKIKCNYLLIKTLNEVDSLLMDSWK